jgi:ectoine hydroxylase
MRMSQEHLKFYETNGYVFLPGWFSEEEVAVLKGELPAAFAEDTPRRVVEKGGVVVRSVYGSHMFNEVYGRLSRHPRLVEPAMQLLGSEVYVYQFKINAKTSFGGDVWQWHQDYVFWMKEDGLPAARVLSAVVFLDEVSEFNGPMYLIPGSHKGGVLDAQPKSHSNGNGRAEPYMHSPSWISNLTADLKYALDTEVVAGLVGGNGIVAPKGPGGSLLIFHGNLVHASPNNISPFGRTLVLISYNSVENLPRPTESPRPDFLVSRDYTPIVPLAEDTLLF